MKLHIIIYNDASTAYIGMDVFSTFQAALKQFDARYAETLAEHGGDTDWFTYFERDIENRVLHFADADDYEVFYREENLQEE